MENSILYDQPFHSPDKAKSVAEPVLSIHQMELFGDQGGNVALQPGMRRIILDALLDENLDFHGEDTSYASHDFHAFPAKFPPQLPRVFIRKLTEPGEVVLDPMMGSGTTIVESYLTGRHAIGVDIDPLAELLARVKSARLDPKQLAERSLQILEGARHAIAHEQKMLATLLATRWDKQTAHFIDYWFARETQLELIALIHQIEKLEDQQEKEFFQLAFSACIITKSGGVSLAFDLAHTRPHRAKIAYTSSGELVLGADYLNDLSPRITFLTKKLKSAIAEFRKRTQQNINSVADLISQPFSPEIHLGDAQNLASVQNSTIDLIVTSPPYAVNAIDYMRANKFSLVWFGYSLAELGDTRRNCIGGESALGFTFENLSPYTAKIVARIKQVDAKRGQSLHRYYSEMTRILREAFRVLKPDRTAVFVVATSLIRDIDTETQRCLAEIGETVGFVPPKIGVRRLDRNRRMMPAGHRIDTDSQIQKRMHEEFVIGYYKPLA